MSVRLREAENIVTLSSSSSLSLKLELNGLLKPFALKTGLLCIFYTLKIVPGIILSANTISHIN